MTNQQIQKNKRSFVRRILKSQVLCCLLAGLSWLLCLIIDFCGGYHGFHLALVVLSVVLVPMLFALIFTLIVLIRAIWSIIRFRDVALSLLLIVVTPAFWFMLGGLCPQRPYLLGFKYRVLRLSSPQELYEIAAKARTLLIKQDDLYVLDPDLWGTDIWRQKALVNSLPGPGKCFWEQEAHAALWEKMPKSRILSSRDSSVVISVFDDNCVELTWGGALVGHWGVRIADYQLEIDKYDFEFIPIEPNIAVYMSN